EVQATAGGAVEALRNSGPTPGGPVLDLGDGSYLTPIQVRASTFGASSAAVGRFWLTPLAARPSAQLPPILLGGPEIQIWTNRAGFSEPLVLSVAAQATGAVTFRWYRNGVLLESETASLLRIAHPEPGHSGRYRVEVSNDAGRVAVEAEITIVPAPPEAPRLQASWTGGARPLRLTFLPSAGRSYRLESSDTLQEWRPVEDPEMVIAPGQLALPAGVSPSFYRLVEAP
ncbi:MAG: hypothetical protein KIT22_03300, partial [Verrucomicrobiae bacterium]|nr:hypothetical protein [Verrucomicrobiae bacterium]